MTTKQSFPPLDPGYAAFLRERVKLHLAATPRMARLRERLLGHGGLEVVWVGHEPHLEPLLERGRLFPARGWRRQFVMENQCHTNAAFLWDDSEGRTKVASGYACCDRGLWRQHSWGVEGGRIVETTSARAVLYFGFELTDREALGFALGTLPPQFLLTDLEALRYAVGTLPPELQQRFDDDDPLELCYGEHVKKLLAGQ
jgi:hypothetical protein